MCLQMSIPYTVVGVYTDNNQRYCDTFEALSADEAESLAQSASVERGDGEILVAGVFYGRLEPVA